jgi:hypothetical protein
MDAGNGMGMDIKQILHNYFLSCGTIYLPPLLPKGGGEIMSFEEFLLSVLASLIATAIAELVRKWLG